MTDNEPRMRAGDKDRNTALERLEWAFHDGQIDFAELKERTEAAQHAKYIDELPALTRDLSVPANLAAQPPHRNVQPGHDNQVEPAQINASAAATGSKVSFGIFGGTDKKGPWTCAPKHTSIVAFGGNDLDFREATLTAQTTVIDVCCLFGGVDIIVPDYFQVDIDVLPIFGGTDLTGSPQRNLPETPADARPRIVVRGFVAFGGVDVKRVPA
jgi:hypothetical protein